MIRYKRLVVVSLAVFATTGIAVATADAPTITGPNQINKVDLAGYKLVTKATRWEPTRSSPSNNLLPEGVCARPATHWPVFTANYVAMPSEPAAHGHLVRGRRHVTTSSS
jgi:hypothetical protein